MNALEEQAKSVLWIVGENVADHNEGAVWDLHGAFSTEDAAVALCTERGDRYFVGSVNLDEPLPVQREPLGRFYYPSETDK